MTEAEWLACSTPQPMWCGLEGRGTKRKFQMAAFACCQRILHLVKDQSLRQGFDQAIVAKTDWHTFHQLQQRMFPLTTEESAALGVSATRTADELLGISVHCHEPSGDAEFALLQAIAISFSSQPRLMARNAADYAASAAIVTACPFRPENEFDSAISNMVAARLREDFAQSAILRDICGNPFRPVACDPAWRTPTVVSLATAIYDERAFDRLPILADALEDAGCDNQDMLKHCREPGEHVRGCWCVDLVLGKS